MTKRKASPRDYEADLRFTPLPPDKATNKELAAYGHAFVKAVANGAGAKRKPAPPKKT